MKRFTIAVTLAVVVFVTNLEAQRRTPVRNLLFGNRSVARTTTNVGWNYNSLKRHLEGPPHYLNVNGWTYNQMLAEHNRDHARIDSGTKWQTSVWSPTTVSYVSAPVQTVSYTPAVQTRTRTVQRGNVQRTRTVQRVCANGVCSNAQVVFDPVTTWYEAAPVVEYSPVVVSNPRPKVVRRSVDLTPDLASGDIPMYEVARGDKFHRGFRRAIRIARRQGELTRKEADDLLTAAASRNVRERYIKPVYLGQMRASSEITDEELDDNGHIVETAIDWERMIPLFISALRDILELLIEFGIIDPVTDQVGFLITPGGFYVYA